MAYYKIKNITDKLPKRHVNKDKSVKIEYHIGFKKNYYELNSGKEMSLSCRTLPISIHGLKINGLINVIPISENDFLRLQKPSAKKAIQKSEERVAEKKEEKVVEKQLLFEEEVVEKEVDEKPKTKKSTRKKSSESTLIIKEEE